MGGCSQYNSACIRDNLHSISYTGATGELNFDVNGDPNLKLGTYEITGGKLKLVE